MIGVNSVTVKHDRYLPLLIFLITGSFIAWIVFRKRTLREECTHYEYDFRFWRNTILGAIVTMSLIYFLIDLYYSMNPSQNELLLEEFRNSRKKN
ncbi:hypothetical protein [Ekhidna sp.]